MNAARVDPNKWTVFSLAAVGVFMSTLDTSIVNVALPTIMLDLRLRLITVEWVVTIYLLTVSSLLLPFGRLSDILGRRWVFGRGLALFSAGSLGCALSTSAGHLIASRCLQGVGAAMVTACTPALVVDVFPAAERGRALGLVGAVVASGLTVGPALGGLILQHWPWPYIFYINVPVGLAACVLAFMILPKNAAAAGESFDWRGALALTAGLGGFLLVFSHGRDWGWLSWRTLLSGALFILCLPAAWIIESTTPHPVLELGLFRIRMFSFSVAAAVAMFASLFTIVFLMPFFLTYPAGYTKAGIGGVMIIPFFVLFIGSPLSGWASDRIGSRLLTALGLAMLAGALFSFAAMPADADFTALFWRMVLAGAGVAVFSSPNSAAALSAAPEKHRGVASALVAAARNLGMVIGVAAAAMVFSGRLAQGSHGGTLNQYGPAMQPAFMSAFSLAMIVGGLIASAGVVISALRGREPTQVENPSAQKAQ